MFGWRYCHYTSFVCMSWKTTCHDTHMQPIMKNYKHAWISLCHENMSATGHEKTHGMQHASHEPDVMQHMSWNHDHENTCHDMTMHGNTSWTTHVMNTTWVSSAMILSWHCLSSQRKEANAASSSGFSPDSKTAKSFWAHMQKFQICFPVLCSTVAMSSVASFACGIWTLTSWSGQSKFHPSMCWSKAGSGSFHTHISSALANETLVAHWRANMCRNLCTSQPSGGSTSGKMLPQSGLVE